MNENPNSPHEQLEASGIMEVWQVAGALIGRAKPEGDGKRCEHRWDDALTDRDLPEW